MDPRVLRAGPERAWDLTGVLARAMADDPMVRWPLPPSADAETVRTTWIDFIRASAEFGALWETEGGGAAANWFAPEFVDRFPEVERASRESIRRFADDDGVRYASLWEWVEDHLPDEPCWSST